MIRMTALQAYPIMLRTVCREYSSLPPVREITLREIRFFYDSLIPELLGRHNGDK